jgi:ribosome biogenesis protein BRX1
MAPLLKAQEQGASTAENRKGKRKADADGEEDDLSGRSLKKKRNKQRVLLLSSRGITHRMRHLMNDLEALLPHVKKGACVCVRACSFARLRPPHASKFILTRRVVHL